MRLLFSFHPVRFGITLGVLSVACLSGCNAMIDAPQTPTIVLSPTQDETAVARLATSTATPTQLPTSMLPPTATSSATPTQTETATVTTTVIDTPTASPPPSSTPTATATDLPTHTATVTPSPSPQPTVTVTPSPQPTRTFSPTPTPTIFILDIPAVTLPSAPTATSRATPTQPPTLTPYVVTPVTPVPSREPTNTVAAPFPASDSLPGDGAFVDPNAVATASGALPVAPTAESGPVGPAESDLPERNSIVVSYAGQIVPILDLDSLAVGESISGLSDEFIFAISDGGRVAIVGPDRRLYVDGNPMTISPASAFGVASNLEFGHLVWSPDGGKLAIRIDAIDPNAQDAIDSGVWVYDLTTNQSWQIFRSTYPGQVAQLHEQRLALDMQWAPNSTALVISIDTPLGPANVFMPANHDANVFINSVPYANATWALDSASLIVSGPTWEGPSVLSRVQLNSQWTYTEYLHEAFTGMAIDGGIELRDGRLAFLGSQGINTFALYAVMPIPNTPPVQLSPFISGRVVSAEWNSARTTVLVTVQNGPGHELWLLRMDGEVQNITPRIGLPDSAHWR